MAVCDKHGDDFNDPGQDFFLSLRTICTLMNQDKHGPWQNWKWGSEYGAYERRISQIIQDFTGKKPVQTREKEDHGITGVSVPTDKARGYWLRDLRSKFEQYAKP